MAADEPSGVLHFRVHLLEKSQEEQDERIDGIYRRLNALIMAVFVAALSISGSFLLLAITLLVTRK